MIRVCQLSNGSGMLASGYLPLNGVVSSWHGLRGEVDVFYKKTTRASKQNTLKPSFFFSLSALNSI